MGARRLLAAVLVSLFGLMATSGAMAEDEFTELSPSSPWVMDYADDHCALRRSFTSGDKKLILEVRQYSPGPNYEMFILADWRNYDRRRLHYRFNTDDELTKKEHSYGINGADGSVGVIIRDSWLKFIEGPSDSQPGGTSLTDWVGEVEYLEINKGFREKLRINIGAMDQPLVAMTACLNELLSHWGIDAVAHANLSQAVRTIDMQSWVPHIWNAYPSKALRKGNQGPVHLRLMINEKGKATDCIVTASLTSDTLSQTACERLMEFARFEPALDASGTPIRSYFFQTVAYQIP